MKTAAKTANQRNAGIDELTEFVNANVVREFEFSDDDFRHIVQLARMHTGIALSDSKFNLVYSRLSRRLRALGMSAFRQYRDYLDGPDGGQEIERFINSISTNLTKLFREAHHFDHLRDRVAAPFAAAARAGTGCRLRVWSAGCSTGEEPYTIAMVLKQAIPNIASQDARILATDIDTDVLAKATEGTYPAAAMDDVPAAYKPMILPKSARTQATTVTMPEELRALIAFRRLNLMDPWPMRGLFDAVFCRNVMIYFDGPTKTQLIERFTAQIKPGGFLYIGHSESLLGSHPNLQPMGHTVYRRTA
jgi:chemotaxis protein methyltransferase CheR